MTLAQQSSGFSLLPLDVQREVIVHVLKMDGCLGCRLVCKDFFFLSNAVIKSIWLALANHPPPGPLDVSLAVERVKKRFTAQNGALRTDLNYLELFRGLNQEWKKTEIMIPDGELKITYSHFENLQVQLYCRCLDFSLMMLWDKVWLKMSLFAWTSRDPKELRHWLCDQETELIRSTVDKIDLSDEGIRYLPVETCCFPNLITKSSGYRR